MKIHIRGTLTLVVAGMLLAGCGGGGGGGGGTTPPAPVPQATTKIYLFGTMSTATTGRSAGVVDSVLTSLTVPANVFINVTSAQLAGDPAGTRRVKKGAIVPSGPVLVPAGNITGLFDTGTRDLTISVQNAGGAVALVADTTSNANKGVEFATINFTRTAGATPTMPAIGTGTVVKQFRTIGGGPSIDTLNGTSVNLTTTFH